MELGIGIIVFSLCGICLAIGVVLGACVAHDLFKRGKCARGE